MSSNATIFIRDLGLSNFTLILSSSVSVDNINEPTFLSVAVVSKSELNLFTLTAKFSEMYSFQFIERTFSSN